MRDLKTLLELLLSEWEANKINNNQNKYGGLCITISRMLVKDVISIPESALIDDFIYSYINEHEMYLFPRKKHNERVEWLKERIKELEK